MKKIITICFLCLALNASAENVMKKLSDGTCVINTTELCKAKGFKSTTPVEVYILKGKVVKVVALPNKETPKYFKKASAGVLGQFTGKKVNKALDIATASDVDACTGATFSAKALMQNIKVALEYYKKNK